MNAERTDLLMKFLIHLLGHKTCTGYAISLTDGEVLAITCLTCGRTSFNSNDVENKYCGHCHVFHEEVHRESRA
jgi:ribosomal protein S27AE